MTIVLCCHLAAWSYSDLQVDEPQLICLCHKILQTLSLLPYNSCILHRRLWNRAVVWLRATCDGHSHTLLCSPSWPSLPYEAQASLKLPAVLLPQLLCALAPGAHCCTQHRSVALPTRAALTTHATKTLDSGCLERERRGLGKCRALSSSLLE